MPSGRFSRSSTSQLISQSPQHSIPESPQSFSPSISRATTQWLPRVFCRLVIGVLVLLPVIAILAIGVRAATTTVVYSFGGGTDGEYLDTDLVMDRAGNIYGTSVQGGDFGGGTVFQLS